MAGKKKEESQELVKQESSAMEVYDYGEDAVDVGSGTGIGFENQTAQDTSIPFMTLLQPITPCVVEQTVEGAQAGMWMNSVTKELFPGKTGFYFVAATTRHEYIQFRPRNKGGGFVARYEIDDPVVTAAKARAKELGLNFGTYYVDNEGRTGEEGDELSETFTVPGVICDDTDALGMVVIAFKGTGIKCYKQAMTTIRQVTVEGPGGKKQIPAIYTHLWKIGSQVTKNNDGVFFVPTYAPGLGSPKTLLKKEDPRFIMAKACKQLVEGNTAAINYDKAQGEKGEKEIPF